MIVSTSSVEVGFCFCADEARVVRLSPPAVDFSDL